MKDDRSIERLLRSARPSVQAPGGPGPCLDAETLAAWVDGGLTSKELRQAELHVSFCARCQAAVAATMGSAPLVMSSESEKPAFSWRLGWLVPLAAGVAAAGLWFMVPSNPSPMTPAPESSQVALGRAAPAAVEQAAPAAPRDQQAPQSSLGALANTGPAQNELRKEAMPPAAAPPAAKAEELNAQRADEFAPTRARQEADSKDLGNRAAADAAPKLQELPAPLVAPSVSAAPAVAPPAPSAATVTGAAATAQRSAASSLNVTRSANLQVPFEVVSPNPAIRWRVSIGGTIERSTDAGGNWTPQTVGVLVDLLAGSSPTPDVCWLVGRVGTVLRTADGGRTWQRVTQVAGVDLQSVTATDASSAEVTASDGRRFRTVDAGITWR